MDSFADSFLKGWAINQQDEAMKRQKDAAQLQQLVQVMQFQKMAADLQRQAQTTQAMQDPAFQAALGPNAKALAPFLQNPEVQTALVKDLLPKQEAPFKLGKDQVQYVPDANTPGGYRTISGPKGAETSAEADARYRDLLTKKEQGEVLSTPDQAWIKSYEKQKTLSSEARAAVFGTIPTSTPGIIYDRISKQFLKVDSGGVPTALSSDEVKKLNLQYKEETPTNDIKVMQQSVPSVMQLIGQTRKSLGAIEGRLGPAASRWSELWSSKVGMADPQFRQLKTDINLLQTRLMKMHVGARGGEYIMKHFQEILNSSKDSPENIKAALSEIEQYANEIATTRVSDMYGSPVADTVPPKPQDKVKPEDMTGAPNPAQHKGRTIRNDKTGRRYKSNGAMWVEIGG